jgi:hypothetical protein
MAQGEFTKAECDHAELCLQDVMEAVPKKKARELIGKFNDLFLFIAAAKKAAPQTPKAKEK